MIKFTPKYIGVVEHPILIVGEKPGKTRDGSTYSLQGNRTGDFVHEAIDFYQNIILTNVVNELYTGPFDRNRGVADGILELINIIETEKPCKIICLGNIAAEYVKSIKTDIPIIELRHPSWVNRFKSSLRQEYINILKNAIIE